MTQAEKEKKEEQIYRQPIVLPQYAEQTAEAVEVYKSKGGGVYEQLQERLQAATDNRNRAARRWRDSYEKTGDVMRGFIPKPKDTGDEQRRLKRIALGQAIGQLVGAIGAGVVGATTEGWTPTPTPANLYNGAAERLQQLRTQQRDDEVNYANLMARLEHALVENRQKQAKDELDAAENDVKNLETLLTRMQIAREQIEAERQRNDANNVARAERTESTNESQERRAAMRQQGKGGSSSKAISQQDKGGSSSKAISQQDKGGSSSKAISQQDKGGSSSKAISQQDVVDYIPKDGQSQSNVVLNYIPEEIYDYAQDPSDENDIDTTFWQRRALRNRQGNTASYSRRNP